MAFQAQGRHPFDCLAATFDSVQGRCVLHGLGSTADGSVHLASPLAYFLTVPRVLIIGICPLQVPDPSFSYYEKGCVQSKTAIGADQRSIRPKFTVDLVELCRGFPIVRYPQKVRKKRRKRMLLRF